MIITNRGDVGIGTASPSGKFHLANISDTGTYGEIKATIENADSTASASFNMKCVGREYALKTGGSSSAWINHFSIYDQTAGEQRITITPSGNVGMGTMYPSHELDVEGYIQAHGYYTGDIVFQKDGQKLWRMFEDEEGLYVENIKTKKVSKVFLEDDLASVKSEIEELRKEITKLRRSK